MNTSNLSLITLVNGQMPHGLYHLQYASCRSKLVPSDSQTAVCVCASEITKQLTQKQLKKTEVTKTNKWH